MAAITWSGAIQQHHPVEAAYLRLFQNVGEGLSLLHRDLKMVFSSFPLKSRCRSDAGDRVREAGDRP